MPGQPFPLPFHDDLERVVDEIGVADWERLRGQHVFMTGGTGFVGKWLLATLLHADRKLDLRCQVRVLSRNPQAFLANAPLFANSTMVECVRGDVRDFDTDDRAFDWVVHAATDVAVAAAPLDIFDSCAGGTRRVLDHALKCGARKVLLVSSGAVYGPQSTDVPALVESHPGAPDLASLRSAYGEGKRVSEWLASTYAQLHGLDVRTARCFAFVGPYQPLDGHFAIGNFLRDAMAGRPIVIQGDGTAVRTYLYAADMALWLWAIALRGPPSATYNVGGREVVSMADLARQVSRVLGSPGAIVTGRERVAGLAPDRYVPDVRKALSELTLPAPTPIDVAIHQTAAWYRSAAMPRPQAAEQPSNEIIS